ncbi:MAG: ABC transporter ATP-binding protein [Myxococcaceae bacterium]|jgi:ABC-2 type transport system ATP-binding protein|nr:ABC transporter ATP-binding protein [Myxococcaceae bacterium]
MIRLHALTKIFKKLKVLDALELDVKEGERIALVGSNGAGKTTMIRCILGEYTFAGAVEIGGKNPRTSRREVLQKVGFVPQLPPPLKMPVKELLRFSASVSGTKVAAIEELALRLGLDVKAFAHQPFFKLSGGQKQKLLIAIALGRNAELLIMDEPAANLDPEARHVFFSLLAERAAKATMIISSHRLDEVASLVNRVIELDRGKVVLDDRVADAPLTGVLASTIVLRRADAAIAKALGEWGFTASADGLQWAGTVAGADRLRFMGMLSRYVGLLVRIGIEEQHAAPVLKVVSS